MKVNPNDFDPKVYNDFSKKIETLADSYTQSEIIQGFDPVEAVKRCCNARLEVWEKDKRKHKCYRQYIV